MKNEFITYKRNTRLFRSARYPNGSENVFKPNMQRGVQFQTEIRKIRRRGPRSVQDAEHGNFTLLFGSGRQRNVQRFIMFVHSNCSLKLLFCAVLVAVVVVLCLISLFVPISFGTWFDEFLG